jgi:hypothetical protein
MWPLNFLAWQALMEGLAESRSLASHNWVSKPRFGREGTGEKRNDFTKRFPIFLCEKTTICQDRLGTNARKTPNKRGGGGGVSHTQKKREAPQGSSRGGGGGGGGSGGGGSAAGYYRCGSVFHCAVLYQRLNLSRQAREKSTKS